MLLMGRCGPRVALAFTLVVSVSVSVSSGVHADAVSDQNKQVQQLAAQLVSLNHRIEVLAEEYGAAQDLKASLEVQVSASTEKVAAEQAQYDQLMGIVSDIAVKRFMGGNQGNASPLLSSVEAFIVAQQYDALSAVAYDTGAGNADDVQSVVRQLNLDKRSLEAQQNQATKLIATLVAKKTQGEKLIAEYTKRSADAKAKYGQLVQEEADRQAALVQAKAAAEAKAAQARQEARIKSASTANPAGAAASAPRARGIVPAPASGGGASIPPPPPVSGRAAIAVAAAKSVLGVPYVAFQQTPQTGFDCSGLTTWAWAQAGVSIPHYSKAQYASSPHVPIDQAQPGDLVFFYSPISHVGMYIGNGQMVDSPHTGAVVRIVPLRWDMVIGVARPG